MLAAIQNYIDRCTLRVSWLSVLPKADVRGVLLRIAATGFRPQHLLDVGANRGKWSRIAKRAFPHCAITLIEPQREMARHLDTFCRRHSDCQWRCCGLSDRIGEQVLTISADTYCSSFRHSEATARQRGWERRTVQTTTLDQLVRETGIVPDVVKIDAESSELAILSRAEKLWGQTELFFVEVSLCNETPGQNDFAEMVALMNQRGYVPYDFSWFYSVRAGTPPLACEMAFVRRRGFLRGAARHKAAA